MSRLDELHRRRAALRLEIAATRDVAGAAAADLRAEAGIALLGLSVARLIGGAGRVRGFAGVAAGLLAAFAARAFARNLSTDRRSA